MELKKHYIVLKAVQCRLYTQLLKMRQTIYVAESKCQHDNLISGAGQCRIVPSVLFRITVLCLAVYLVFRCPDG